MFAKGSNVNIFVLYNIIIITLYSRSLICAKYPFFVILIITTMFEMFLKIFTLIVN